MPRIAGKNTKFSFAGTEIQDELTSIEMTVDNTLTEVTAFADTGATFVEGLPNAKFSLSGAADFATGQGDATIFGTIGTGTKAFIFKPTGGGPGANDPNYTGNALVASYRITAEVGGAVTYGVDLQVQGKPTRATS